MNATDQGKLIDAGFTIIRGQFLPGQNLVIRYKGSGGHEWRVLEKGFPTKAALLRRMKELLKDPKTVED